MFNMIIGKIGKNERNIKFHLNLSCTKCGKSVPGGMKTSKNYYDSDSFKIEIYDLKKTYLCGICRDAKRIKQHIQRK